MITNFYTFKKQINYEVFVVSKNYKLFYEYEKKLFHILDKSKITFKIINEDQIENNKKHKLFTLDPEIYQKNILNFNINLFVISVDKGASNFLSLYKYSSIYFSNKKLKYEEKNFKKFLLKFETRVKIKSFANFILSFFNLFIYKTKIKKYSFKIEKSYSTKNGKILGKAYVNRYINPKPSLNFFEKYKFVKSNLKSKRSKRIYDMVAFSKPNKIWKHKYNQFFLNNQYFDYYKMPSQSVIINIGVDDGFEIPFFLSQNPDTLLNIDPTGREKLHKYVKFFVNQFKNQTKILFCEDYLYSNEFVFNRNDKSICSNLKDIIKNYKLEKIDFIKSDIEGLEINLVGELENIVKKFRPILAISIYHLDKSNLDINYQYVEIPYQLIKFCKNYNFELNHYTYHRSETIIYCIPNKKS